ncbi:alcohol dehydrogenase GroES domain protein [Epithele typhae]|uniref:alcohol dehydrogenase GroES domain protein n=1 Tax=Epithele typhae TaxID=378194 RepID=UPI002008B61E|nr:alcohol dehydrogenase GroES domain protein [Epithele typhae]KAH9925051.1 alcohol dehydrogenase GroES domain protein [Epithele typhae]
MTMRAIRLHDIGDVRLDNIPEPQVGDNQIKIKVAWNGICGSDLHCYRHPLPGTVPTKTVAQTLTNETLPIVLGHEFSGTIVEVGTGVDSSRFAKGQNVVVEPMIACEKSTCAKCSNKSRNFCPHMTFIGLGGGGGGLSEYVCVDPSLVYALPDGMSLEAGALVEPLTVAWHAVKGSKMQPGASVLVCGAGPVGLLVLKVAKALGASWVAVSEPAVKRRQLAKEHGADAVFDPTAPGANVPAAVFEATGGRGADVVFDCAGVQPAIDVACQAVRVKGTVMVVALWAVAQVHLGIVLMKEAIITGSCAYNRDHAEVLQALAEGKFPGLESLITRRIGLEDCLEKGILALINEKDEHGKSLKILVHPNA